MSDTDAPDRKAGHTVTDHVYGIDLAHTHDGFADHDHDFPDEAPLEENPIWIADHVSLMSVGIDIGSSGTQVIFSRINLRRLGEDLTSRYFVASRETLFQSAVALTPYRSEEHIDETTLGAIIVEAYAAARIAPGDIDTGAVILTGEALRRDNAAAIAAYRRKRRRLRLRHCRTSHGIDAGGLWVRRRDGVQRRTQAHPQYRYRRRHDQDRRGGERQGTSPPRRCISADACKSSSRRPRRAGTGRAVSCASIRRERPMRGAPALPGTATTT